MKQETIEEASNKYAESYRCPATNDNEYCKHDIISAINFGAKWQQERNYTEEEVLEINNWYLETFLDDSLGLNGEDAEQKVKHLSGKGLTKEVLNYWFEQFKK